MYVHHVMEVCCIVFDIDKMLFEFCMNFLNIKKNKKFVVQYFMFSSRFILFSTLIFFFFGNIEKCPFTY